MTTASRWALQYRVTKDGPWTFKDHPWSEGMHDSEAEYNIGQKAAQMAYSETVLNVNFKKMDVDKVDCLYILPNRHPDATEFSSGRFDSAIENSPHLQNMFSNVKNVGHKKAGSVNLYIRGSRAKSSLKSLPVGMITFDELDEMTQENIPLALHRTSGQKTQLIWMVSTPTRANKGINTFFKASSQEHFFFKCPHCSRHIELTFPESLVITAEDSSDPNVYDSHLICTECKHRLDNATKPEWLAGGIWVPSVPTIKDKRGFYINQLYSCMNVRNPVVLAREYLDSRFNQAKEQEFFNSSMGMPHVTKGAQITDDHFNAILGSHKNHIGLTPNGLLTMGADVNYPRINYVISQWFPSDKPTTTDIHQEAKQKVLEIGVVDDFDQLEILVRRHRINYTVIDAQPERRSAEKLAKDLWGCCSICFYNAVEAGKAITEHDRAIVVHRTTWMDIVLARFKMGQIELPCELPPGFREHMKAPARIFRADQYGNLVARYETEDGDQDHYFHAMTYSEIAFSMAMGYHKTVSIKSPM